MAGKITATKIQKLKDEGVKIVCLTAYDFPSVRLAEAAGVDLILVGDSLGSVLFGFNTTVPVTIDMIEHHVRAASRASEQAMLVADLPFGSYQGSVEQCMNNSVRLMQAGAQAVKLEGVYPDQITSLIQAGIPVMGHIGMTPQSVNVFGGHRVQGKTDDQISRLITDAKMLESLGCFAIVLELVPALVSKRVSEELSIPTIGIGAGPHCDGQIQVWHDMLGIGEQNFKHAKRFGEVGNAISSAIKAYSQEVKGGSFPDSEHSF